jgi:iron complex outermembrane receptor protein
MFLFRKEAKYPLKKIGTILSFLFLFVLVICGSLWCLDSDTADSEKIIVTAKEIEEINATDIVDLLNHVPGIEAGESSVRIRGSYDVKVFLDGQPLNDPLASYSKIKWGQVSLYSLERIDIYKGSGAVAFGDGTSGGAICLTSKKAHESLGRIKTELGNLNTQQLSFNASDRAGPFGLGAAADYYHTDGYRTNQDKASMHLGIKSFYQTKNATSFNVSLDYADEERGNAGYPAYPTPHAREYSKSFTSALATTAGSFNSTTYLGSYRQRSTDPDRSLHSSAEGGSMGEDISYRFSDRGGLKDVATGLTFKTDHISASSLNSYHEESYGISLSKAVTFRGLPLSCTFGLRTNIYSAFETVINPEIKLAYTLGSAKFQLSAVRTNNVPPILKRFYGSSSTRANPDLGMERATNVSFSAVIRPVSAVEAGITAFYSGITDRITYVRDPQGSGGMYENFGRVTRKGVDLSVDWKPFPWLALKPSYEYLVARDEKTGLSLACSPEHRAQLNIRWRLTPALAAITVFEYTSKQYTRSDNTEFAGPYHTIELRVDYALGPWRFSGRIQNLTDETYLYGDGLPAPPRTWLVGVSREF